MGAYSTNRTPAVYFFLLSHSKSRFDWNSLFRPLINIIISIIKNLMKFLNIEIIFYFVISWSIPFFLEVWTERNAIDYWLCIFYLLWNNFIPLHKDMIWYCFYQFILFFIFKLKRDKCLDFHNNVCILSFSFYLCFLPLDI